MTGSNLRADFAMQSSFSAQAEVIGATITAATTLELGRGVVLRLDPGEATGADAVVRVHGMIPRRFYRLKGMPGRFARADDRGLLSLEMHIARPTSLLIVPVV